MTASSERHAALAALLPFALLTILTTLLTVGKTTKLLEGLTYYLVPETEAEKARARLAQVQRSRTSARRRKGSKAPATDELGDESIAALRLTKANLVLRPFWAHFDHLVFFAAAILVNFAAAEVASRWRGEAVENALLPMMCVVGAGSAVRALVKMELDPLTPAVERQLAAVAGAMGFAVSALILLLVPADVLDFEMERTGAELAPALIGGVRRKFSSAARQPTPAGSWKISDVQIALGLSIFAGVLSGSLFAPAVRASRSYAARVRPPSWGRRLMGANALEAFALHVAFALPLVVAAAHAAPLSANPAGWDAETFSAFKAVAVAVAGAAQLAATRGLVQGFLDGALVTWYELKHGEEARERGDPATVRAEARRKTEVTLHVACKVAVQSAAPAAAMISFACLLGAKRTDPAGEDTSLVALIPPACWRTVAGYLGWWTCACWGVFTAAGVAASRAGLLGGGGA